MTRFALVTCSDADLIPYADGEWVRYVDAKAIEDELRLVTECDVVNLKQALHEVQERYALLSQATLRKSDIEPLEAAVSALKSLVGSIE